MYPVKNATALTVPIFVCDSAGNGVTGIADGSFTKRISKNGGAFAALTITLTEMENGFYSMPLGTGHTDTNGVLTVSFSAAGAMRTNLQFRVHSRLPDDLTFPNVSGRGIDVDASGGVEVGTVATGGITAASFAAGAIDAAAIATDAIDADAIGTGAINSDAIGLSGAQEIADAVWEAVRASHVTAGTFGEGVASVQGNVTGSIGSLGAAAKADVNAEVVDCVNVDVIAQLAQATPATTPTMRSALMLLYMAIRNETLVTSSLISYKNNAGTVIYKKTISDDGTVFTKQILVSGP